MRVARTATTRLRSGALSNTRRDLLNVTLANAVIMVLNIAIGLLTARHFSVEEYGRLSYFINVFGSLRLLGALGMTSQIVFDLSRARSQDQPVTDILYSLGAVRIVTLACLTLGMALLGVWQRDPLLVLASIAAAIALLNDFGVGALQGLGSPTRVIGVLVLQPVLYSAGAVLIVVWNVAVEYVYLVYTGSFIGAVLLAGAWVIHTAGWPRLRHLHRLSWNSWRFAGSMYVLAIVGTIFTSFATLYLGYTARFADAGSITIPLNLVFMAGMLANTVMTTVYFPRMTELYGKGDHRSAQSLFTFFSSLIAAFTILISSVLIAYPTVILTLLYGTRYQLSAPLLALLAPLAYVYTMQTVLTFTIVTQGRVRAAMPGAIVPVVLLLLGFAVVAGRPRDLQSLAVIHVLAAATGLIYQYWRSGYALGAHIRRAGTQLGIAALCLGAVRLFIPDAPQYMLQSVLMLGLLSLGYATWTWRGIAGKNI